MLGRTCTSVVDGSSSSHDRKEARQDISMIKFVVAGAVQKVNDYCCRRAGIEIDIFNFYRI